MAKKITASELIEQIREHLLECGEDDCKAIAPGGLELHKSCIKRGTRYFDLFTAEDKPQGFRVIVIPVKPYKEA